MEKSEKYNVEDVTGAERPTGTHPVDLTGVDRTGGDAKSLDTIGREDRSDATSKTEVEYTILESLDQSPKCESNDSERDGDCTSERTCLEAMTPDGQDYYLRLGDSPRRRSALRLSRIIARQQLLRRLAQGRSGPGYGNGLKQSSLVGISFCLFFLFTCMTSLNQA